MFQSRRRSYGPWAIVVVAATLAIIAVAMFSPSPTAAQSVENSAPQWRRTVAGWERADLWQRPTAQEQTPPPDAPRQVVWPHPAVIAGLQAAVALSLLRFPRRPRNQQ